MAETISDLYFRLGLDYKDLQSGFVDAEKTISANLRQLNRQKNIVQLRAQVELNGLDDAENSTEALRIKQQALNEQMNIQRDRIQLVNAAYQEMVSTQGESAEISQQLALQLEQERLAMSNLERQTRSLAEQQKIALGMNFELLALIEPAMKGIDNAIAAGRNIPIPHAKAVAAAAIGLTALVTGTMEATEELRKENPAQALTDGFTAARNNISNDLSYIDADVAKTAATVEKTVQTTASNIQHSTQIVSNSYLDYIEDLMRLEYVIVADTNDLDSALQAVNSNMQYLRTELAQYAMIAVGVGKTMQALSDSAISFARPAIDGYRELSRAANELNISVSKTSDLLNIAKLTGTDFGDIRDWVRGVQDAILKGDSEDPEVIATEKYNVVLQDAYGNLLDFNTAHDRLIEGALKAAEAGELEAYAIMTQGEGIKDILPYLKSYVQAKRDFNQIRWSTTDEAALKEASRNLRFMEIQLGEFKSSLSSLGVPLANMALESSSESYKTATDLIEDNREAILYWEFVVIEAFKRVKDFVTGATTSMIDGIKGTNEALESTDQGSPIDALAIPIIPGIKSPMISGSKLAIDTLKEFNGALDDNAKKTKSLIGEIKDSDLTPDIGFFEAAQKSLDEYLAANARARAESEETAESIAAGLSYSANRIKKYKAELAEINRELKFGDNDYQKSLADLNAWYQGALKDAKHYAHEREVIEQLRDAKRLKIETDRANKLQEIRDSVSNLGANDLQRQLIAIAKERDSWIKAGMSISEAVELSQIKINQLFKERADKLQELRLSLSDSGLTDLQKSLMGVDRDKRSWLEAGMSEVEATEIAERQKANIIAEFNKEVAANIDSIWNSELTNRLNQIDNEKQAWIRKGLDEQKATAWAEAAKAREILQFNSDVIANLDSIWKTSLENRLAQIEREKQAWIQKGVEEVKSTKWAEQAKVDAQRDAAMSVLKSQLEAYRTFQQGGYEGLMKFRLEELYKSGITKDDLQITPQQLADFQKAQDTIQRNLLPNFRTDYDRAEDKRLRDNQFVENQRMTAAAFDKFNAHQIGERMFEPLTGKEVQLLTRMPIMSPDALIPPEQLDAMYKPLNSMADEFATLTPQIKNVTTSLGNLDSAITKFSAVEQPLPEVQAPLAQFESPELNLDFSEIQLAFDELLSPMEEINAQFAEMTSQLIDVTSCLSNFADELSKFQLPQIQTNNQQAPTAPPNITVTVQIDEAHAWDSQHIQELADKVADKIEPELVRAIGGDSYGY